MVLLNQYFLSVIWLISNLSSCRNISVGEKSWHTFDLYSWLHPPCVFFWFISLLGFPQKKVVGLTNFEVRLLAGLRTNSFVGFSLRKVFDVMMQVWCKALQSLHWCLLKTLVRQYKQYRKAVRQCREELLKGERGLLDSKDIYVVRLQSLG